MKTQNEAPRGGCRPSPDDPFGQRCEREPVCSGFCRARDEPTVIGDSSARFSRPSEAHFLGKCDAELAVPCPEQMKVDFAAIAALMKTTPAELARRVLSDWMYGRLAQVQRMVER